MQRIGLCMIVKNEAPTIERCLASVKPFISHWTIVDTGSTDDTRKKITKFMKGTPGSVYKRAWRDFGHNRSEALALSRGHCDYQLVIDADDVMHFPEGFVWPELSEGAYQLDIHDNNVVYRRLQLFSTALPWRYVGVLHEHPDCAQPCNQGHLTAPTYHRHGSQGARSRDAQTYRRDAETLTAALAKEPDNARYAFYLAQSWRDAGDSLQAAEAYGRRAGMPGWIEETYIAWLERGRALQRIDASPAEIRSAWLDAYQAVPTRAEALHELARFHRIRNEWALAYLFAKAGEGLTVPPEALFSEVECYHWRVLDELAVAAYWTDRIKEAKQLNLALLENPHVPDWEHARLRENLRFCQERAAP